MPTIIEKEIRKIVVDKRTIQNPDVRVVHNVQDKRESLQTFRFVKLDSDFKKSIKIFRRYLYYFKNKCDLFDPRISNRGLSRREEARDH